MLNVTISFAESTLKKKIFWPKKQAIKGQTKWETLSGIREEQVSESGLNSIFGTIASQMTPTVIHRIAIQLISWLSMVKW